MKRYILFFLCLSTLIVGCNDQQDPILSARIEYARGNLLAAYNLCSEAINADSNDYDAYILRGKINLGMKNNDAAVADYTRAIELQPQNATGYYSRAFVYSKIGETEKGEADEDQARKRDPNAQLFSKAFADPGFISPRDNTPSVVTSEEEETLDPRLVEELLEEDESDSTDAGLSARDRFREALNKAGTLPALEAVLIMLAPFFSFSKGSNALEILKTP